MNPERSERIEIPVLPLRDVVVYPHMVIPLFVGREKSIRCLEAAMDHDKKIMLVAQKEASTDEPGVNDLFTVGTVASILQMLKLPDGTVKVLVEGLQRARISALSDNGEHFSAKAEYLESPTIDEREQEVLVRTAISQFEGYIKLNKKIPPEVLTSLNSIDDPARLADTIAAHMPLKLADKQSVLEMSDVNERLEYLMAMMESEIDLLQVEKRIRNRVKKQMEKSQREYYLNEQMKAIQKELGEMDDAPDENEALKRKIDAAKMPKEAKEKAEAELQKLKMMSPMSAEATVVRGYIDWMVQVPWNARSKVKKDLRQAQEILDTDHYGLERVKDRILEYLAVQSRVNKIKGPILCLVGPPGVGKTSIARSIARATNREFVRMSLGGVRDEAEIRGHRRTYVGAIPGRIINSISEVGTNNPLFLLDEVDKLGNDFRGDPASALLEVLDPEQNKDFTDHYLEIPFDLSNVMFITTANTTQTIPRPLLDRMEVIELSSYIEEEKVRIAEDYLVPKVLKSYAIRKNQLTFSESAIREIIRYYTRESGVRNLERQIASVCRKVAKRIVTEKKNKYTVTKRNLENYLGAKIFREDLMNLEPGIGVTTGMAWTAVGGVTLQIESVRMPGSGHLILTGQMGDVMKESAQTAMGYIKSLSEKYGLDASVFKDNDVQIHIPEGATPKDGPSAGVTMCTALFSLLSGKKARRDIAMTGEITLQGNILPVGGIKEKVLAAYQQGIRKILLPKDNAADIEEIPKSVRSRLEFVLLEKAEDAFREVLISEESEKEN